MPTKIGIYSEQWLVGSMQWAVAGARKSGTQSLD